MMKKGLMQCCHILKVKEAGFVLNFRILFANATMLFHHVATQWLAKSSSWIHRSKIQGRMISNETWPKKSDQGNHSFAMLLGCTVLRVM